MSPHEHPVAIPEEKFDLLVDGELSEAERRELLSMMDYVPGGWRRCALAFLEAQSWKEAMRCGGGPAVAPAPPRRVGRRFWGGLGGTVLAMAASFTVALSLGLMMPSLWQARFDSRLAPFQIAEIGGQPAASNSLPRPAASRALPAGNWQLVTLPIEHGPQGAPPIQVPVREADRWDEHWLDEFGPAVPPELLKALEQSGHRVQRSRRVVPFRLEDGRQLVVPCEQVELRFVGNPDYQ